MAVTTHATVLTAMADAITTLDSTDYQQGGLAETWTEALSPFFEGPGSLPDSLAHLGFCVFLSSSRPSSGTRQHQRGDYTAGMEVESAIDVVWTYRLRVDAQVADYRLALSSAEDVVEALLAESWSDDATALAIEVAEPRQIEGEPWLLLRTSFLVSYEIGV